MVLSALRSLLRAVLRRARYADRRESGQHPEASAQLVDVDVRLGCGQLQNPGPSLDVCCSFPIVSIDPAWKALLLSFTIYMDFLFFNTPNLNNEEVGQDVAAAVAADVFMESTPGCFGGSSNSCYLLEAAMNLTETDWGEQVRGQVKSTGVQRSNALPEGWIAQSAAAYGGQMYYVNLLNGKSSWDVPHQPAVKVLSTQDGTYLCELPLTDLAHEIP
eukprot:s226_g16.t2